LVLDVIFLHPLAPYYLSVSSWQLRDDRRAVADRGAGFVVRFMKATHMQEEARGKAVSLSLSLS